MNIGSLGNYTVQSAYAYQLRLLLPYLVKMGHKVTVVDIRNGGSSTAQIGDITVLSTFHDPLGNDSIAAHYHRSKWDVLLSMCDVWGFNPDVLKDLNWWPITPVDHSPVPPGCVNSLQAAKGAIALSRFGQAELRKVGIDALYMPHMLDPKVWYPALSRDEMLAARRRLNISEDVFLVSFVGVNDSNPSRKGIPELLAAWSMLKSSHPDWLLYLHTTSKGNMPLAGARNGVDIDTIITTFGIDPQSILMPDEYRLRTGIPASELSDVARASDVFILPTRGEGFGVPLIEMQHAGCPVITTDFAGGAELCASGWLVEYEVSWSWQNATYANPGIASISDNLERAYSEHGNIERRREAATFARDFESDYVVTKYVTPTIAAIAEATVLSQKVAA